MNKLDIKYQKRFIKRFINEYIYLNDLLHSKINEKSLSNLKYWHNFNNKINEYINYAEENKINLNYKDSGWYYD